MASNVNTACGSMGQRVSDTTSIADYEKILVASLKMIVNLNLHVVELNLNTLEKCVIVCGTRRDVIQCVDHFDDAIKNTLWHNKAQIARGSIESRS